MELVVTGTVLVELSLGRGTVELSPGVGKVELSLIGKVELKSGRGRVELSPGVQTGRVELSPLGMGIVELPLSVPFVDPGVFAQGG